MICVDSSVWIAVMRGEDAAAGRRLGKLLLDTEVLLPIPVRLELLAGIGSRQRSRFEVNMFAVPAAVPSSDTWERMEAWCFEAADAGQHFGFADLLIAALAAEAGAEVWSLDRAFERMERMGFLRCYRPRH